METNQTVPINNVILKRNLMKVSSIWGRTKSYLRGSNGVQPEVTQPEVTWPEVTWLMSLPEVTMSGSILCACATGSCAISALVGPFDRKWQSHVTGRGLVRKCPWPEVGSVHARIFPPRFFLNSRTGCDQRSLDPFRGSLWVYATGSCATPLVSLGCSLRRPRPITLGNPASYI